jgi:L-lactate dehydrogenase complex protein LldG
MLMSSRERILAKLRQGKRPFPAVKPPDAYEPMVVLEDTSPKAVQRLFLEEAQKASCVVHEAKTPEAGIEAILAIVEQETAISSWDPVHIPLPGLAEALYKANIKRVGEDAAVRVGLTGVDAALAATGSIVIASGSGRYRGASLLPPVHIAVMEAGQIMPDLESWWAAQRAAGLEKTRQHSNVVIITGPSRTADIAMQPVMGMHGPQEVHLVVLDF